MFGCDLLPVNPPPLPPRIITAEDEYTTRSGGYKSAIDGLEITNMVLKNAGDECVRLRCEYPSCGFEMNVLRFCLPAPRKYLQYDVCERRGQHVGYVYYALFLLYPCCSLIA